MVPSGTTTATIPTMTWYVTTSPAPATGEWDGRQNYISYHREPEPPDPRKDPKNWAIWFREFLALIFPTPRLLVMTLPAPVPTHRFLRCRSGPPPEREWKMKNWVQALKSQ